MSRRADDASKGEAAALAQMASHADVGGHHKAFDNVACGIFLDGFKTFHFVVNDQRNVFNATQSERAMVFSKFNQPLTGFVLQTQLRDDVVTDGKAGGRRRFALEPLSN